MKALIGIFVLISLIHENFCSLAIQQNQTVFVSTFVGPYFKGIALPNQAIEYGTFTTLRAAVDAVNNISNRWWTDVAIYLDNGIFEASGLELWRPVKILSRPGQPQSTLYCNVSYTTICTIVLTDSHWYGIYNVKIVSSLQFHFIQTWVIGDFVKNSSFEISDCSLQAAKLRFEMCTLTISNSTLTNSIIDYPQILDFKQSSFVNSTISSQSSLRTNLRDLALNNVTINIRSSKVSYTQNMGIDVKIKVSDFGTEQNVITIDQSTFINSATPIGLVGSPTNQHSITVQNSVFINCQQAYVKSGNYIQRMYNNSFYNDVYQYHPAMCSSNDSTIASYDNKVCGNFPSVNPSNGANQPCIWNFEYWTAVDDCLVCDGNNRNKDCNGICFGPNKNCSLARTWYVQASNYSSGGNGSFSNPFRNISTAISVSNYKDTIVLLPGSYYESNLQFYGKDLYLRSLPGANSEVVLTSNKNILKFEKGSSGAKIEGITFNLKDNGIVITNGSSPTFYNCTFRSNTQNKYPIVLLDSFSTFRYCIFLSKGIGSISVGSSNSMRSSLLSIYNSKIIEGINYYNTISNGSSILVQNGGWAEVISTHFNNYRVATSISINNDRSPVIPYGTSKAIINVEACNFHNYIEPSPSGTIFCRNETTLRTKYNNLCGEMGTYNGNLTIKCVGGPQTTPLDTVPSLQECLDCNSYHYSDISSLCIEAGEVDCGNGVCSEGETQSNCFADCALEVKMLPVMDRNPELFSGTLEHCYTSIPNSLTLPVNLQFTEDTLGNLINQQTTQKLPGLDHLAHGIDYFTGEEAVSPLFTFIYCSEDLKVYQDTYRGLNYYVPEQVQVNSYPKCSFDVETNSYSSTSDFSQSQFEQTGISAEASGSFPIEAVTVGVSGGFSKEKSTEAASEVNSKQSGTLSSAQAKCLSTKIILADIDILKNSLHPDFLFDLSQTTDENSMIPMIKKYGTFYYKEATMGGKLVQMTSTSSSFAESSGSNSMQNSLAYNVGASVGGGDFSLSASSSKSSSISVNSDYHNSFLSNSAVSDIVTYGGAPGSFGPGGGSDADTSGAPSSWDEWASSIDFLPVPIEYQLGLVNDLIDKNWKNVAGRNIFDLWRKTEVDHYNSLDYAKTFKSYRIQSFYTGHYNDARYWAIAINGSLGTSDYQYLLYNGDYAKFKTPYTDSIMVVKDIGEFRSLHFDSNVIAYDERPQILLTYHAPSHLKTFPTVLMTDQSKGVQWVLKQTPEVSSDDNKMIAVFDKPTHQFYINFRMYIYRGDSVNFPIQIIVTGVDQTYVEITTSDNFFDTVTLSKRAGPLNTTESSGSLNTTDSSSLNTTESSGSPNTTESSESLDTIESDTIHFQSLTDPFIGLNDSDYKELKLMKFGSALFPSGGLSISKVGMLPPDIKHIRFEFLIPSSYPNEIRISIKNFELTEFREDSDTSYSSRVYTSGPLKKVQGYLYPDINILEFDLFPKQYDVSCECTYCNKDRPWT